jgi:hypothetical protein
MYYSKQAFTGKPHLSIINPFKVTHSRLSSRQLLRELILRPDSLSRFWFSSHRFANVFRHSFRSSLLEPLGIIHFDLLSPDTIFRLFLILAVS